MTAAPIARTTATGTTTSVSLRRFDIRTRAPGSSASTRCRSRSGATGGVARSSETSASLPSSSLRSGADMGHLLFESLQSPAQAGRTSRCADPEHARRARPVELELGRSQPPQGALELRRQSLGEDGLLEERLVARVRLLSALAPGLGAEPVDGRGMGDAAKPCARRAAAGIEAPPAPERALERLGREILRSRAVAREVDEVAVDGVEMLGDDVREGRRADETGRSDGCRQRVHDPHTAPTLRIVTPER